MPERKDEREKEEERKTREIQLDIGESGEYSRDAWMEALKELEGAAPPPEERRARPAQETAGPPEEEATPKAASETQAKPFEEMVDETSTAIEEASSSLEQFQKENPNLFAPNIIRHWQESLKETRVILERQRRRAGRGSEAPPHSRQNGDERKTP